MHNTQHLFFKLNQVHILYILIIAFAHIHMISLGEYKARSAQVVRVNRPSSEQIKDSKADHRSYSQGKKETGVHEKVAQAGRQFQLIQLVFKVFLVQYFIWVVLISEAIRICLAESQDLVYLNDDEAERVYT